MTSSTASSTCWVLSSPSLANYFSFVKEGAWDLETLGCQWTWTLSPGWRSFSAFPCLPSSSTDTPSLTWWLENSGLYQFEYFLDRLKSWFCHLYSICVKALWNIASCRIKILTAILDLITDQLGLDQNTRLGSGASRSDSFQKMVGYDGGPGVFWREPSSETEARLWSAAQGTPLTSGPLCSRIMRECYNCYNCMCAT